VSGQQRLASPVGSPSPSLMASMSVARKSVSKLLADSGEHITPIGSPQSIRSARATRTDAPKNGCGSTDAGRAISTSSRSVPSNALVADFLAESMSDMALASPTKQASKRSEKNTTVSATKAAASRKLFNSPSSYSSSSSDSPDSPASSQVTPGGTRRRIVLDALAGRTAHEVDTWSESSDASQNSSPSKGMRKLRQMQGNTRQPRQGNSGIPMSGSVSSSFSSALFGTKRSKSQPSQSEVSQPPATPIPMNGTGTTAAGSTAVDYTPDHLNYHPRRHHNEYVDNMEQLSTPQRHMQNLDPALLDSPALTRLGRMFDRVPAPHPQNDPHAPTNNANNQRYTEFMRILDYERAVFARVQNRMNMLQSQVATGSTEATHPTSSVSNNSVPKHARTAIPKSESAMSIATSVAPSMVSSAGTEISHIARLELENENLRTKSAALETALSESTAANEKSINNSKATINYIRGLEMQLITTAKAAQDATALAERHAEDLRKAQHENQSLRSQLRRMSKKERSSSGESLSHSKRHGHRSSGRKRRSSASTNHNTSRSGSTGNANHAHNRAALEAFGLRVSPSTGSTSQEALLFIADERDMLLHLLQDILARGGLDPSFLQTSLERLARRKKRNRSRKISGSGSVDVQPEPGVQCAADAQSVPSTAMSGLTAQPVLASDREQDFGASTMHRSASDPNAMPAQSSVTSAAAGSHNEDAGVFSLVGKLSDSMRQLAQSHTHQRRSNGKYKSRAKHLQTELEQTRRELAAAKQSLRRMHKQSPMQMPGSVSGAGAVRLPHSFSSIN
jgi:hypothetical protein